MLMIGQYADYQVHHFRINMLIISNYHKIQNIAKTDGNVSHVAGIWL